MSTGFAQHFPQDELEQSETATAHGIDNSCPPEYLENLKAISWKLEKAREIIDAPLIVTSGYRCPTLNLLVTKGASSTGVHPCGLAADFQPTHGIDTEHAFYALQADDEFMKDVDQLILERGCVHIGLPLPGRKPRHELRRDQWIDGVRQYPLIGIWRK